MLRRKKSDRDLALRLRERLTDALDMPLEAISAGSTVEIAAAREAVVCGCLSVLEYSPACVVLRTRAGRIRVCGDGLRMCSLLGDRITVSGRIEAVYTEEAER